MKALHIFIICKYASRRPTYLLAIVVYLLELNLADRLEETFGFGPYYRRLLLTFLCSVSCSMPYDCQTLRSGLSRGAVIFLIVEHIMYTYTESIVEYRPVSHAVSLTILKTGTLRVATV